VLGSETSTIQPWVNVLSQLVDEKENANRFFKHQSVVKNYLIKTQFLRSFKQRTTLLGGRNPTRRRKTCKIKSLVVGTLLLEYFTHT
jgi:hypothetical protein